MKGTIDIRAPAERMIAWGADPNWRYVDKNGHVHKYSAQMKLPTLRKMKGEPHFICKKCEEVVIPAQKEISFEYLLSKQHSGNVIFERNDTIPEIVDESRMSETVRVEELCGGITFGGNAVSGKAIITSIGRHTSGDVEVKFCGVDEWKVSRAATTRNQHY